MLSVSINSLTRIFIASCIFILGGCAHSGFAEVKGQPGQKISAEDAERWAKMHEKVHSTGLIQFQQGSIQLSADAHENLKRVVIDYFSYLDLISKRPGKSGQAAETKLAVIGFADICGDAAEVMETSRKRALLVERVLIDYGLPSDAIKQVRWHGVEGLSMFQASGPEGECQNPWMNMVNVGLFFAH